MDLQQIEYEGLLFDGPLGAGEIASRLDDAGMVRLAGAVPPAILAEAQEEVADYVARHGGGDHDLLDHREWECPTLQAMATSERIEHLLQSIDAHQAVSSTSEDRGYNRRVLRIHDGTGATRSNPYVWHYDASTLTLHVPITIPGGDAGDLAAFPGHRPAVRKATTSVREKVQPPARWAARTFAADPVRHTVALIPGDAYVFHGYRTLHTGLPWPAGAVRANVILHYGYPKESTLLRTARSVQKRLDSRRRPQVSVGW